MIAAHSGDLGDIVFALPAFKHLKVRAVRLVDRPYTKALTPRAHLIRPLLEAEGFEVLLGEGPTDLDASTFRQGGLPWGVSLARLQARWLGIKDEELDLTKPWITGVKPAKGFGDKYVFARSPRYNNHTFPWKRLVEHAAGNCVFVGLPEEHRVFCGLFGEVPYHPTADMLEVAEAIAGCKLFAGNQSSPNSIAEGLKVRRVVEIAAWVPDVITGGGDVQYVPDGLLTSVDGLDVPAWAPPKEINVDITPPGLWRYAVRPGHEIAAISFGQAKALVARAYREANLQPPPDIGQAIIDQTCERIPGYGEPRWSDGQRDLCRKVRELEPKQQQQNTR